MRKKHSFVVSDIDSDQEQTHNLDMCPGCDLNPQTFGVQSDTPTEEHQPGLNFLL